MAALQQDNYEEAELALKEAFKLSPKDAKIREALKELSERRANYVIKVSRGAGETSVGGSVLGVW